MRGLGLAVTWEGGEGAGREEAAVVGVEDPGNGEEETTGEVESGGGATADIFGGVGGRVGADLVIIGGAGARYLDLCSSNIIWLTNGVIFRI